MFVDYCGLTVPVVHLATGEVTFAQIFVACWGASNYTDAEATPTQALVHWIGARQRALTFFGGVPECIVPDNLKAGVTAACRYEPGINRSYQEFAEHYGVAIVPANPFCDLLRYGRCTSDGVTPWAVGVTVARALAMPAPSPLSS